MLRTFLLLFVLLCCAPVSELSAEPSQAARKKSLLGRINGLLTRYESRRFGNWISLGRLSAFKDRVNDAAFDVLVDPDVLEELDATASYLPEGRKWFTWYDQDLILEHEPGDARLSVYLLWHEMVHAISHGWQLKGKGFRSPDHVYIGWAESSMKGLERLVEFDDMLLRYGKKPTEEQSRKARLRWTLFKKANEFSAYLAEYGPIQPSQREELKQRLGFDVDHVRIRREYLTLGYPPQYFLDVELRLLSPNDNEVASDRVAATARIVLREPEMGIIETGFLVNGREVAAPLAGDRLQAVLDLPAAPEIHLRAYLRTLDGLVLKSRPVLLTRGEKFMSLPCCHYWLIRSGGKAFVSGYYFNRNKQKVEYASAAIHASYMQDPNKGLMLVSSGTGYHIHLVDGGSSQIPGSEFVVVRLGDKPAEIHRHRVGGIYSLSQAPDFSWIRITYSTPEAPTVQKTITLR